jgi:hypothetical protein
MPQRAVRGRRARLHSRAGQGGRPAGPAPTSLHYDRTWPATYPNGRVPAEDVDSLRFAWLTDGKVPPSGLKPHDDLLAHFPYLGPPNPSR